MTYADRPVDLTYEDRPVGLSPESTGAQGYKLDGWTFFKFMLWLRDQ
jgi:hypothetical protein